MTSPTMIQKFLYKVNLSNLIKLFEDEQIDYDILGYMSKNDFDDIGVCNEDYLTIVNNLMLIL